MPDSLPALRPDIKPPATLADLQLMAKLFLESGLFPNVKSVTQAFVKIKAGEEYGMGAFAAMQSLNIIQGKVELSGDAQARLVKASGKYDYVVTEHTDEACTIEFYRLDRMATSDAIIRTKIGVSRFTLEDAKAAGLGRTQTWQQYPRNMLFYRALTNGTAWHAPDALVCRSYAPGEISGIIEPEATIAVPRVSDTDRPPKTFADKLKRNVGMQDAIDHRDSPGWDGDGDVRHPFDDENPDVGVAMDTAELKNVFGNPVAPPLSTDEHSRQNAIAEAKSLIRDLAGEIKSTVDIERTKDLIEVVFGSRPEQLAGVNPLIEGKNMGQLLDAIELLRQRKMDKQRGVKR